MNIWIVESSVAQAGGEGLRNAVAAENGVVRWLSPDDEALGRYGRWEEGDRVIFRGSFQGAESFRCARPWARPGVIGDPGALRCSSYYPSLGLMMLNSTFALVPVADLKSQWDDLRRRFSSEDLFLRPDSGAKAFSGQLVPDFERFELREGPYLQSMSPTDLCLVAPPRDIAAEFRAVVVDGMVVAGSRYRAEGRQAADGGMPDEVTTFANAVAATLSLPDIAYMLDVAMTPDGSVFVVELNSFSCSDLYAADPLPVVRSIHGMLEKG